jgi:hypothetical protein
MMDADDYSTVYSCHNGRSCAAGRSSVITCKKLRLKLQCLCSWTSAEYGELQIVNSTYATYRMVKGWCSEGAEVGGVFSTLLWCVLDGLQLSAVPDALVSSIGSTVCSTAAQEQQFVKVHTGFRLFWRCWPCDAAAQWTWW